MASQSSGNSEINRILQSYEVDRKQEADLMIQYTKNVTRELVFAVDLMSFVMKLSNQHFQNFICSKCFGRRGPSDFDDRTKRFVERILAYKLKAGAARTMKENLKVERASYEEFKSFVNASSIRTEAVPYGGSRGYGTFQFLLFCVMMAEMCTIAYQHGMRKAPRFGIMLMCRTYSNFVNKAALPPDPFDWIHFVARAVTAVLQIIARWAH